MTEEELKNIIDESLDNKFKQYWVDRELHYKHHEFIDKWMKWTDDATKTIWNSILKAVILGILALIALGFFVKFRG